MKTIDLGKLDEVAGGWHGYGGYGGWAHANPYWQAYRAVAGAERYAAYQNAQAAAAYWPLAYAYAASRYYY
jgi:hypothetical protein